MAGKVSDLRVKIFADGADESGIREMAGNPLIAGFTTNPTLMRRAGVVDYESFARSVLPLVGARPISFEVFADDEVGMTQQALRIASWGPNVFVKIPITDTRGVSSRPVIERLSFAGVQLNVTALTSVRQVEEAASAMCGEAKAFISLFAGRIADTGRDPVPMMREAVDLLRSQPQVELIWASPRELLNIFHADESGCHVITVTTDLLAKLPLVGKDLEEYSLETVRMFHGDAQRAGYRITIDEPVGSAPETP